MSEEHLVFCRFFRTIASCMDYKFAGKVLIVLFCLFHMAGVFAYTLPDQAPQELKDLTQKISPWTRPYILATSQWQKWNLFSPDPLRRVVSFHIDAQINNEWQEVKVVGPGNINWWHAARELKTIRRMEEEQNLQPLRERYVTSFCEPLNMPSGTQMRLRKLWFVIPKPDHVMSMTEWRAFVPEMRQDMDVLITCP